MRRLMHVSSSTRIRIIRIWTNGSLSTSSIQPAGWRARLIVASNMACEGGASLLSCKRRRLLFSRPEADNAGKGNYEALFRTAIVSLFRSLFLRTNAFRLADTCSVRSARNAPNEKLWLKPQTIWKKGSQEDTDHEQ